MTYRKTKPLRSLFFQFIQGSEFEGQVSDEHVAKILSDAGFIELILNKYDGRTVSHYKETEVLRAIPKEAFLDTIEEVLREGLDGRAGRDSRGNV